MGELYACRPTWRPELPSQPCMRSRAYEGLLQTKLEEEKSFVRDVLLSGGPKCEVEERVDHGTLNQWKRATLPNRPFHGARHDRSCIP
jgi:hypothetical protein